MLNDAGLEQYINRHALSECTSRFIREVRNRATVIDLQERQAANSIVLIYSRKMGNQHIPARSRTLLAAAARWHEFNPSVLEYYVNPYEAAIETKDENGVVQNRAQHSFRFLVLEDAPPYLEDWREEGDLITLERKDADRSVKVGRYFRDECGRWRDRDAEQACAALGLTHRLRTSRNIPQRFLENIRFLQDYMDERCEPISAEARDRLERRVAESSVTFERLMREHGFTADDLFLAIVQGIVHVNLFEDNLRDGEQLYLHRDSGQREVFRALLEGEVQDVPLPLPAVGVLRPGCQIQYGEKRWELILAKDGTRPEALFESGDGHQLVLATDEAERLLLEQSTQQERSQMLAQARRRTLFDLSSRSKEEAVRKLNAVRAGSGDYSPSTMRRARRMVEESQSTIEALIALAGRHADKGSRAPRLPKVSEDLACKAIETHYNKPATDTSGKKTYDQYQLKCIADGVPYMSYVTFLKRLHVFANPLQRSGKRVAYKLGDIPLTLDIREPVHGLMPHEVLYCDHTLLNLATAGPQRQDWGKVWLSAGIDGHIPRARAMYLSYSAPSSMSILMLFRDYVRRHGRLPRIIVVDGGKEFRCAVFTKFCSIFGIEIRYRGPGRPRGGALIERLFGVTEAEFLSGLEGNTAQMKEARTTTASVQPNLFRAWTFPSLYRALEHYLFCVRPEVIHPAIGMTPAAYEAFRLEQTGHRKYLSVAFDENLLLLTCPSPPQMLHRVYAQRGIWESGRYYWHSDFSRMAGRKLEVRIEPWCANVLYVYDGRKWDVAIVRNVEPYRGRTRIEVEQARRDEKRMNQAAAARDQRSPERARRMVELLDPLNFSESIALKQRVMAAVYTSMGMTNAMPLAGLVPALAAPPDLDAGLGSASSYENVPEQAATGMARIAVEKLEAEPIEEPDEETAFI